MKPTVLVVEDNPDMRASLVDLFADDYVPLGAQHGAEALQLMEHQIPALIVTDLGMPVMDGRRLIEVVRNQDRLRHVPIIVFSAEPLAAADTAQGLVSFLAKPKDVDALLSSAHATLGCSSLPAGETAA